MKLLLMLAAAATLQDASPERAQDAALETRVATIKTCLQAAAPGDYDTCIGAIYNACSERPGGHTTVGMIDCNVAETRAWEALMEEWIVQASADDTASEENRAALRNSQTAWLEAREQSVAVYRGRQGSIWGIIASSWERTWTAQRALWLLDLSEGPI